MHESQALHEQELRSGRRGSEALALVLVGDRGLEGYTPGSTITTPVDLGQLLSWCGATEHAAPGADPIPEGHPRLHLRKPRLLQVDPDGIWAWDERRGRRAPLGQAELRALARCGPTGELEMFELPPELRVAAGHLVQLGLLALERPPSPGLAAQEGDDENPLVDPATGQRPPTPAEDLRLQTSEPVAANARSGRRVLARVRAAVGRKAEAAPGRIPVHALFHTGNEDPCLALGMITAHLRAYRDGELTSAYDIHPPRADARAALLELQSSGSPAIFLFSDYLWSVERNLEVSTVVKELSPDSVVIHGGPSAPSYAADAEEFLRTNPQVDVLVRGEGEVTAVEVLEQLRGDRPLDRLAALRPVAGLTIRLRTPSGDQFVRTADRERSSDVNVFPSPYLTGEFDHLAPERRFMATVETNRGCPYGCTFCDWGSATNSRIRHFDTERVLAELEWAARNGLHSVYIADANFGMFKRDVDIARHLCELKETHGSPRTVVLSLAKNTTKYTAEIVRLFVEAGIESELGLALQTNDVQTLEIVRRRNLPPKKYDDLAEVFRRLHLPVLTDIMIGLPGSNVDTFLADVQRCLEQEMTPRFAETHLLPNAPMNAPEYREEHQIVTDEAGRILSTATFSEEDLAEIDRLRRIFRVSEHFGLLRHVLRFVQWDHGVQASEVLRRLDTTASTDPASYPLLSWVARCSDLFAVVPFGWRPFYDETARFLQAEFGIPSESGLEAVLELQDALMPCPDRSYPLEVTLDHDVLAYRQEHLAGRGRRLSEYGPVSFVVDDPRDLGEQGFMRYQLEGLRQRLVHHNNPAFWDMHDWELESPLKRPLPRNMSVTAS
jgi:hypothetical protein